MTWWFGDAAGALVIAPAIILWARRSTSAPGAEWTERAAVYAGAAAIGLVLFSPLVTHSATTSPLGFLAILPLTWAALRCNQRDTATAALILSGFRGPGDYVVVSVADTGSGMPDHVLARAFDPFFTTKGPGKGSGLGLSMVHGFVKQVGGAATIESVPANGTTVRLYLQRAIGQPDMRWPVAPAELPQPVRSLRILVVDDDDSVRSLAKEMLEEMGHDAADAPVGGRRWSISRRVAPAICCWLTSRCR